MDLGHNHFTGVIPSEIGNMRRLEYLSLNNNDFRGRVPREIGLLNNMSEFTKHTSIPAIWPECHSWHLMFIIVSETLDMATNQLTGLVPSISNMINLKNLHLYENGFTGTIPESILQLQSIEVMFLSSNKFSGSIPKEISRLSRSLKGLYLSDNDFEGSIPTQMCIMTSLGMSTD
jgi:Leucine-rich repeat (LRR) protein